MVRTVEKKYQVWLAGYYDDFNGARAIPDDRNQPSDATYNILNSHFGNPMNGEAFLNPRYRFSVEERNLDSERMITQSTSQHLKNDGIFEWLTFDDTRISHDDWEGRVHLQYPDGHVANRYKFNSDDDYGDDFYQRFINGHNSDASYIVPTGDNDATFGHDDMKDYDDTNYNANLAGVHSSQGEFVQRAHLTGVWMGEMLEQDHTTTTPRNIYQEIHSPSKQPFLCIQAARKTDTDSEATPSLIYDGPLNTRIDGDTFTMRLALQSGITSGAWPDVGIKFEIGFPKTEAGLLNDTGYAGVPAIDYTLDLDAISYDTQALLGGGSYNTPQVTIDNAWLDVDFVFNYSDGVNGQFDVWVNGSLHAENQNMPSGTTATDLYGYQLTVTNEGSSATVGYVSYLMIDRAGLVRYITDDLNRLNTDDEVQITNLDIRQTINGISTCTIVIADDPKLTSGVRGAASTDYLLNLRNLFIASTPLDWNLLIFADTTKRIDRPVWRGEVSTFNIKEKKRSRLLTLRAHDSMSYLDRQLPLWDVGQKGENTSEDATDYWSYDAQGFRDIMYLGADKLRLLDGNVGFDSDSSYKEAADQRTQLGSGHPIQMYNNEDTYGPNNIENEYEGYSIDGFVQKAGSTETIAIMKDTAHGITTSAPSGGVDILSSNHTATGKTPSAASSSSADIEFASSTLAYNPEASKIVYMGKFPVGGESKRIDYYDKVSTDIDPDTGNQYTEYVDWAWYNTYRPSYFDWSQLSNNLTTLYIYFEGDPNLNPGDTFYINRRNDANTVNLTASYNVKHTVSSVHKFRNYFANSFGGATGQTNYWTTNRELKYLWVVRTNTDYSGSESHGIYGTSQLPNQDALLQGNSRFSWSKDTGVITNVTNDNLTAIQHRALHARWMRDLPKSLWFKYHFGVIKHNPKDEPAPYPITSWTNSSSYCRVSVSQTLSPTTTVIEVDVTAYNAAPNAGVGEIWTTSNTNPATYTHAKEYKEKFIYQGKTTTGSGGSQRWYLIGVKHINATYAIDSSYNYSENGTDKRIFLKFQDYEDDYKHLWLLWSDMRNNGDANADGSLRKTDFGLQYPISDNYDFDLYFADQVDADGNIDKFGSLRAGEDLDVWSIDATIDPFSQGPFSKPVDYDNKVVCTISKVGNANFTADMLVTKSNHGLAQGDYVAIINSNYHDNFFEIASVNQNDFTITKGWNKNYPASQIASSDTGNTGGIFYCPIVGSNSDHEKYQDWEDKGGSFLVVDAARFFNLNTHINGGKTGQSAGGRTDLTDYFVEERSGFPALIDNYWTEALASYQTTGTLTREHENQNKLISSVTLATLGFADGMVGLPVHDPTIFDDKGVGKLITTFSQEENNQVAYFTWNGKLETEVVSDGASDASIDTITGATTFGVEYTCGLVSYQGTAVVTIETERNTFITDGVKRGMLIERTSTGGDITYHNIINVLTEEKLQVSSDGNWALTDTFKIPPQLAAIYVIDESHITDAISDDEVNLEENLWDIYYAQSVEWRDMGIKMRLSTTEGEEDAPTGYEVHSTVYSPFMLRLMMHIQGFYKSINGGTFWESDKINMIWNAAIMDSWLPSARVNSIFDINNVPVTKMMTTYNDTSSNDSFGSVLDIRGVTLGSAISKLQQLAGYGSTNGLYTSFSYLIGRDNRFEFRPKFNSGLVFNRDNIKIGSLTSDLTGQITNVRVYYNNGNSFVDWPATNLSDSTRWNIVTHDEISSSEEALLVAKQEYNQRQNTPLSLTVHPIIEGDVEHKMIESGRYGYIADPYIALMGNSDYASRVCNWTILGTGGVLFPGMVNALDGNMNVSVPITHTSSRPLKDRYGSSKNTNASGDVEWAHNYYWYGSNSISNAVQIVHIPNKTPVVSAATSQPMRMWIDLKSGQSGTDIDNAQFTVHVADYSFSGKARSETLSGSIVTKDVKHSGYYEIGFPSNYGAVANAKIVFSFNAEYCRALLRHRCGDPTDSNILAQVATNTHSIFPLGKRVYTEMGGGFRNQRVLWYAPRIHICRDLSYVPASYVSVTDAGLELNSEPMVIQDIFWKIIAGKSEDVSLALERDESIGARGLIGYLFPKNSGNRQQGSTIGEGGGNSNYTEPTNDKPPPYNDSSELQDPQKQKPEGGTKDETGQAYNTATTSRRALGNSRMDLPNDGLSGDSMFSILGQGRPSVTPSTMRGIEGMDVDIRATSGTASVSADGYVFGGKGLMGGESSASSKEVTIETSFLVPKDIMSNKMSIQARVTHSPMLANNNAAAGNTAVFYVTVVVKETGEKVTNTIRIGSGLRNQIINLLPMRAVKGLNKSGRNINITITRKPGIGEDDADTTSVTLHNLDVKMHRASAHTASVSKQFSYTS